MIRFLLILLIPLTSFADGPLPFFERLELKNIDGVDDQKVQLILNETTHKRNYILDLDKVEIDYVGDGDIEFSNGKIINRWKKAYFVGGGAFWYDVERDFKGKLLRVIDHSKANDCFNSDEFKVFHDELSKQLQLQGEDQFCVWQKVSRHDLEEFKRSLNH